MFSELPLLAVETFKNSHIASVDIMEVIIKDEGKERLVFEIKGADHAVAGTLKDELWEDKATTAAGYTIAHPLVGVPEFVLETSKKDPKKVVGDAIQRVIKHLDKVHKDAKSLRC